MEDTDCAEILAYSNVGVRRMATTVSSSGLNGIYPGDSEDIDYAEGTNYVSIIPPTGKNTMLKWYVLLVTGVILILVLIKLKCKK